MPAFTKAMLDKLGLTPAASTLQAVPPIELRKKAKPLLPHSKLPCTTPMPFTKLILFSDPVLSSNLAATFQMNSMSADRKLLDRNRGV
jgi:hypothetical protein